LSTKNVFLRFGEALDERKEKSQQYYLREVVTLRAREQLLVPRNKPHLRLNKFGIVPRSKYGLDVYLEILNQFAQENSPEEIVKNLHKYDSLKESKISRKFVKKVNRLGSILLMPQMMKLVPDDGQWTIMIDGSQRSRDGFILVVVSALPHQNDEGIKSEDDLLNHLPSLIPIATVFLPSENENDVKQLLREIKPKLPSQPKSTMSDFSDAFQSSMAEVFPSAIHLGCHYHLIERIAEILVYPVLRTIRKKIRASLNALDLWARHRIHQQKSENLVIIARTMKKLANSDKSKFGEHLITLCNQMRELSKWAEKDKKLLKSDPDYKELMKILTKKVWKQIQSILPRLEFVIRQFNQLRRLLTNQTSKTELDTGLDQEVISSQSTTELDQLISDWTKLGKVSTKQEFNTRFTDVVETINRHYDLIIPQIMDNNLPRTNSPLENLYGRIKQLLRKWSGSKQIRSTFEWAAQLAAISQSLKETDLFDEFLGYISSYDWIEKVNNLAREMSVYRFQVHMANSIAKKDPRGVVSMTRNLAISDIIS